MTQQGTLVIKNPTGDVSFTIEAEKDLVTTANGEILQTASGENIQFS